LTEGGETQVNQQVDDRYEDFFVVAQGHGSQQC
jgi:hypothetical protein